MDVYQSRLQPDGTTFPPVTPDVPEPPPTDQSDDAGPPRAPEIVLDEEQNEAESS